MFKTLATSWPLLRTSTQVVLQQPMLALTSLLAAAALLACFTFVFLAFRDLGTFERIANLQGLTVPELLAGVIFYFITVGIVVYFNAVLVAAASDSLNGAPPTLAGAFAPANDRVEALFGWVLLAGTIGHALELIRGGRSLTAKAAIRLLGIEGGYSAFLVVPAIVLESAGPLQAFARSSELLKQTWGNRVVANFGFLPVYLAVITIAAVPLAASSLLLSGLLGALCFLFALVLSLTGLALMLAAEAVLQVAQYSYAVSGAAPAEFGEALLLSAFVEPQERGKKRFGQPDRLPSAWQMR